MMTSSEQDSGYGNPDNVAPVIVNYPVWARYIAIFFMTHYGNPDLKALES